MPIDQFLTFSRPDASNTALFGKALPESSFIAHPLYRLRNAKLLWHNPVLLDQALQGLDRAQLAAHIVDNHAYADLSHGAANDLILTDSKLFLVPRYGCSHEFCAGGSVDSALNGNHELKGIGMTPLAAPDAPWASTRHGMLSITQAISDAIWGEVCHQHLPYGAVRTLAIIHTGTTLPAVNGEPAQAGALAIRQPVARAAHLERATLFRPAASHAALRGNDPIRVADLAARLPGVFADAVMPYPTGSAQLALSGFAERVAHQLAALRIKRFSTSALGSDDIALDGRLVNFGAMSVLAGYADQLPPGDPAGIWYAHTRIAAWLQDVAFFVDKYRPQDGIPPLQRKALARHFAEQLAWFENVEMAQLAGLTVQDASAVVPAPDGKVALGDAEKIEIGRQIKQALRTRARHGRTSRHASDTAPFATKLAQAGKSVGYAAITADTPFHGGTHSAAAIQSRIAAALGQADTVSAICAVIADYQQYAASGQAAHP